jgi:hypothetical protein
MVSTLRLHWQKVPANPNSYEQWNCVDLEAVIYKTDEEFVTYKNGKYIGTFSSLVGAKTSVEQI